MRGLAGLVLVLAVFAMGQACTNETIVLGQIPLTDAGAPAPPPTRCVDSSTCPTGYYCSLPSCDAPSGTCVIPDLDCPATEQPVCGCDNITYFNSCLLAANGVSLSAQTPCQDNPQPCGGPSNATCPTGAQCAKLALPHEPCAHDIPGTCWVLPPHCPTATPANYWDSCDPTGGVCLDTCSAIQAGGPYHRSEQCP